MIDIENEETTSDVDDSKSVLQIYMGQIKHYARSEEETAALNQSLSQKYAETLAEFEERRKTLTDYYLGLGWGKPKAENQAEAEALKPRDLKTRKELTNLNLRLVVKIAHEYPAARAHIMDLISEGNIGLMKGIDRYDPSRGVPLPNYCGDWIRAYVIRWIVNNARLVKLGTTEQQRKLFFNLAKEKRRLETLLNSSDVKVMKDGQTTVVQRELGTAAKATEVDDFLLAETLSTPKLKIEVDDIREMKLRMGAPEASLQMGSESEDDSAGPRMDDVKYDGELPDHVLEALQNKAFRKELFREFQNTLPSKLARKSKVNLYQMVFERRIMKYGEEDQPTLEELAEEVGLTRQRLQQVDAEIWEGDSDGKLKCGNDPDQPFRGLKDFFLDEIGGPV
jgi:RNA polymerase sigma-32 factor